MLTNVAQPPAVNPTSPTAKPRPLSNDEQNGRAKLGLSR